MIGAGDGGALFMNSYQHPTSELELVGILDKDAKKKGQKLGGIPVLGSYDNLPELAKTSSNRACYRCDSVAGSVRI